MHTEKITELFTALFNFFYSDRRFQGGSTLHNLCGKLGLEPGPSYYYEAAILLAAHYTYKYSGRALACGVPSNSIEMLMQDTVTDCQSYLDSE